MLINELKEDIKKVQELTDLAQKTMGPSNAERAIVQQMQQKKILDKEAKKTRSKTFKLNFKDEKGYYKVTVKSTKDGIKYSFGYFDQNKMPDLVIKSEGLTDDGKKKYEEFKTYISQLKKTTTGNIKNGKNKRNNT